MNNRVLCSVGMCLLFCSVGMSEVFDLGEVVVVGKEGSVFSPVTSVEVVDEENMRDTGAQTVDEALEYLPGVFIEQAGKGTRHVNIRGFTESELKVMVDGIPVNETYFRTVDLSQYPAAGISEIRVTKGIPSVLYGANSMGGVVNIVTKKGGDVPTASGEVLISDYSTIHSAVGGGGSFSNLNVSATYMYQTSDGFPLPDDFDEDDPDVGINSPYHEDGGVRNNSDYIKRAFTGKTGFDSENGQVFLSFEWHDNERGIPIEYNRYWRYTEWNQWHLNLVGEQRFGNVNLKARAYYFKHDDTLSDDAEKTVAYGGRSWFDESTYDDYSAGGMLRSDWALMPNIDVRSVVHYQFEQNRQRELNTKGGDGQILIHGWTDDAVYETEMWDAAVEAEGQFGPWIALGGVGYDLYRPIRSTGLAPGDDADAFNPQVGLRYEMQDNSALYASVGRKTRFPHMKELYSLHAGGNPDLEPERCDSADLGGEIMLPLHSCPVNLKASVFYNNVDDMILSVDTPDGESRYENIGRAVMKGGEVSGEIMPIDDLSFTLNYTLLDAWDEDQDRRLQQLPRNSIKGLARWQVVAGSALMTQLRYAEGAVQYLYDKKTRSEQTRDLPDHFIWDIGIEQQVFRYATLMAHVDNLLDENYDVGDGPMPGRRCWIGMRIDW